MQRNDLEMLSIPYEDLISKKYKFTPMMEQYINIKKDHMDYILLFRMGDFYEVFFDDAITTSKILNISLTKRGKVEDTPIPMAGIPHHAANNYIDKLVDGGVKVAICEQIEDPKDAIGIVKRAVTQIVSPGIPYNISKAENKLSHFILAVSKQENNGNKTQKYYLSAIDYTTGEFYGFYFTSYELLIEEIKKIKPREFLSFLGQWEESELSNLEQNLNELSCQLTFLTSDYFNINFTSSYLKKFIPNYERDELLIKHSKIFNALGALSYYMQITQKEDLFKHLRPFKFISNENNLKISYKTLKGLEIIPSHPQRYSYSLLGLLDKTQTSFGKRLLYKIVTKPLYELKEIKKRQSFISKFLTDHEALEQSKQLLSNIYDLDRILAKVNRGNPTSSDLINLANGIDYSFKIKDLLPFFNEFNTEILKNKDFKSLTNIATEIKNTINDSIGASLDKGTLINSNNSPERDKLAKLAFKSNDLLSKLESKYKSDTGISKLKIKNNNIFGFFIEIPKSQIEHIPSHFIRKQTLVNNERYITEELSELEQKVFFARDKLRKVEREIFKSIIAKILNRAAIIQSFTNIIASIDVFRSLAEVTHKENFTKPIFSKVNEINFSGIWHPIIKSKTIDDFVPHDIHLKENKYFGLITGPNMAGKTTLMREVAIAQLMAQIGCFIPANENSKTFLTDGIFSRLGASDDIINGQSTFMVEMTEAAEILRHSSKNSLIILDEIGRGTSTYDGLSIAWSIVDFIVNKLKCFCLFATHYHELIHYVDSLEGASNYTVETINDNGNVQFTYKLLQQGASESFGIHVAKLAGLPKEILEKANQILLKLESNESFIPGSDSRKISKNVKHNKMTEFINEIDLLNTTPLEAMNILQKLKSLQK